MRTLLTVLTCLVLFATPVMAGDWEDGMAAYGAGDHDKAFRLWKVLAEQGNAEAQGNLGYMYDNGEGVSQDNAQAFDWYHKAAVQGHEQAQYKRGLFYATGKGIPQNYVEAYAWWSISATQGEYDARRNKGIVEEQMTPDQIAKGKALASEYWEKYVVPFQTD